MGELKNFDKATYEAIMAEIINQLEEEERLHGRAGVVFNREGYRIIMPSHIFFSLANASSRYYGNLLCSPALENARIFGIKVRIVESDDDEVLLTKEIPKISVVTGGHEWED